MNAPHRPLNAQVVTAVIAGTMLLAAVPAHPAAGRSTSPVAGRQQATNPDARTMAEFGERVKQYAALHRKIEGTLPSLPKDAEPAALDKHQRAFAAGMAKARAAARPGDVFTPDMQRVVRTLIGRLFRDTQARRALRESVMDDNPKGGVKLAVNARYPDAVPLSTMPPDILAQLPTLPEELEYRFVGEHLILLDPDAHIVVDYVERALPR